MIARIESGLLTTDLDAGNHRILNVSDFVPLPATIASSADPRLGDQRVPLDASVTDAKVAAGASIAQAKLNLNGQIPTAWLGSSATQAAQGNLVEFVANKGVAGGYATLDGTGKVPAAQMPSGAGTGTVTSVGLSMPPQFATGSAVVGAGSLSAAWNAIPNLSWFGNVSGGSAPPTFQTTPLPTALIPAHNASLVTSGVFAPAQLPLAVGVGGSHAPGLVPDPGASGTVTDYLARDMSYKPIPLIAASYRPQLSAVVLTASTNVTGARTVTPTAGDAYIVATIFYSLSSSGGSATGPFSQYKLIPSSPPYVSVPPLATIWFYSSAVGYTDSAVVSYTNPNTV
jgi:hypothetical protein